MIKIPLFLIWAFISIPFAIATTELAITIDDAPRGDSEFMTGRERTSRLINSLKVSKVDEVIFFCNPQNWTTEIQERLWQYNNAGHVMANHSNNHPNLMLEETLAEFYLQNIKMADEKLKIFPRFKALFRYPYLEQGDEDREKRKAVERGLVAMGYSHGFVTDETYDWHIDSLFQKWIKSQKEKGANPLINEDQMVMLRSIYLTIMTENIEFYRHLEESLSLPQNLEPIRHTLLIHENDLHALFLPDLIDWLRQHDYKIIPATRAYENYWFTDKSQDSLYFSQRRLSGLALQRSYKGTLFSIWQNRDAIQGYFDYNMKRVSSLP